MRHFAGPLPERTVSLVCAHTSETNKKTTAFARWLEAAISVFWVNNRSFTSASAARRRDLKHGRERQVRRRHGKQTASTKNSSNSGFNGT